MTRGEKIIQLLAEIPGLSDYRLGLVQNMVQVFAQPWKIDRISDSDIISESALLDFGDILRIHRALKKGEPDYLYELVEIPKSLLERASMGRFEMRTESTQNPKPGYCFVEDAGEIIFSLYFDGGGERKLQIKNLKKELCKVHASWQFDSPLQNPDQVLA